MTPKNIGYWLTTGLVGLGMLASSAAYLSGAMDEALIDHFGYPAVFVTILGTWKLLGAIALLVPGFARIKEWAYAGFFFTFSGAVINHLAAGDGLAGATAALVFTALLVASYALRPEGRKLEVEVPEQLRAAA